MPGILRDLPGIFANLPGMFPSLPGISSIPRPICDRRLFSGVGMRGACAHPLQSVLQESARRWDEQRS
jgi:hypothetical protein